MQVRISNEDNWIFERIYSNSLSLFIRQKGRISKRREQENKSRQIFWKTNIFYPGGKKCSFFRKFGVICFLVTSVLRFALLPYYRRFTFTLLSMLLQWLRRFERLIVFPLPEARYQTSKRFTVELTHRIHEEIHICWVDSKRFTKYKIPGDSQRNSNTMF